MKTVEKREVYSSQSAEYIKNSEPGKFHKLISDTFIIKMENGNQGYAIRHLNGKDMILIDTTEKGAQKAVKHLKEDGYQINAIILTHKGAIANAYDSLKTISEDAGGAPIFTHPMNVNDSTFSVKDISVKNKIFDHFSLIVHDFPSKSGEATVLYTDINEGMLFAGCSATGSDYDSEEKGFKRPDLGSENKNYSLSESWGGIIHEFMYFFPHKGKPAFNLTEGEQKDLILALSDSKKPNSVNPNL